MKIQPCRPKVRPLPKPISDRKTEPKPIDRADIARPPGVPRARLEELKSKALRKGLFSAVVGAGAGLVGLASLGFSLAATPLMMAYSGRPSLESMVMGMGVGLAGFLFTVPMAWMASFGIEGAKEAFSHATMAENSLKRWDRWENQNPPKAS